jgi:hypothetical protein
MAIKHMGACNKKWPVAFAGSISLAYFIFALPFHIPLALYAVYNFKELINSRFPQDRFLTLLVVPSLFLALTLIAYSIYRQRINIKYFRRFFEESGLNVPLPLNIAKARTGLFYLALDTKNGTLLYINHPDTTVFNFFFPKDVCVMGFGMHDWECVEMEGNKLTIYTGNPELPSISITTRKANPLFEKLQALRQKTWTYEHNVPGYVEHQAKRIADARGLNLILPPN